MGNITYALAALSLVSVGVETNRALAASIGVNFTNNNNQILASNETAGAPGYSQKNWNNRTGDYSADYPGVTGLIDSDGNTVANVFLDHDAQGLYQNSNATPVTPDDKLMKGYLDAYGGANSGNNLNDGNNQPYVAFTGLSSAYTTAGYSVIVYVDGDATDAKNGEYWIQTYDGRDTARTDLSPHLFSEDSATFSGTYTQITSTDVNNPTAGNFMVFSGLTSPNFVVRTNEVDYRSPINAVQVVAAAVPEPATFGLLASVVATGLLGRRRR